MRKKLFSLMMTLVLAFTGIARADELTICDGTSRSAYIPVYGLYVDTEGTISEFIIPADSLTNMVGGEISGMTFYLDTPATGAWNATVQFYLAEVDGTTLTGVSGPDAGTVVFEGTVNANSVVMTVTFDDNYTYNGGNLLVGSYVTGAGTYKNAYFEGVETTETTAYCSYEGLTGVQNEACSFLPKVTFTYESGSSEPENEYFYISASGWAIWAGAPAVYPSEPGDECVIDALYVSGFVEPAVGVTVGDIDLTTDEENYSVLSMEWFDNDDLTFTPLADDYEFEAGHTYYMALNLEISDECTLADSYTVYVNQSADIIDPDFVMFDEGVLYTYSDYFEVEGSDECIINTIELAGLVEPAYGAAPAYDITVPEGADYTVGTVQWVYVNPTTTSESGTLQEGDLFNNENVEYYLMAAVYPNGDCEFDPGVVITINGEESLVSADLTEYNAEYNAYVVMSTAFTVSDEPEPCVINTIELNGFEEPVEGGSTELNVTYSSNDYTLAAEWLDSDGYTLTAETFEIGNYFFYVEMTPNSDECTVEDLTYYINGTEVTPDQSNYNSTYGYYWFAIVYTVSGDCAGGFDNDFEAGAFCDWTTLDADGDGHCWKMGGASTSVHGGAFSVYSESYYNDTHTILYPDNYLISPKTLITADKPYVSFWACAQDANWPAEYFGLGVSTTTADAESFVMLQNWTMTAKKNNPAKGLTRGNSKVSGDWYQYIVDLSSYIGDEVYVCIRHYNCSDKFFLNVDDIELIEEPVEPTVVSLVDFETNDLSQANFTNDGTYPWTITTAKNHTDGGSYCIKSGNAGVNSSTSSIEMTFDFESDGQISFACLASCESASNLWDYGIFYIDGTQMNTFLDVTTWQEKTYNVNAGSHTFKWTYKKDDIYAGNDDCFYVDDIKVSYTAKKYAVDGLSLGSQNLSGKAGISKDVVVSLNKQIASLDLTKANAKAEAMKRALANAKKANRDGDDPFANYNLYLDDELVAEGITDLDFYMQDAEEFEDESVHAATLEAVYESGATLEWTKTWTYRSGDNFEGAPDNPTVTVEGEEATIAWEMPYDEAIGAVVYRDGEIIAKLRNGETSYTDEFDGDMPEYCVRIIQNGTMDEGVYYALADMQCAEAAQPVCVIDALYVEGFVEPAVGVTVGDIALTTSTDNYSIQSVEWYDSDDFTMTALADDYEFEAGHSYYMTLNLQISDECTLDDDYTVYVNEDDGVIDPSFNYFYEGVLYTYSVDFEVEEDPQDECPAPANLAYTLNGAELTISWDASTMDDPAYTVYRSTDGENYTPIDFTEETTYTCALLEEGTYYYQVTASGMTCESDPALTAGGEDHVVVEYLIPVTTCYAPVNLDYNVDGSNVTLTWEMQSNVTVEGYNVYRAVSNNGSYELIANVTDATYTDEGLENGTYRYQVTAINVLSIDNTCESDPALAVDGENNYVEATIDVTYTCEAPTNFASSLEGDELTLAWNAVSDPNAVYAVYVTIDGVEQDADIVTETSVTYNLNEGSTYYFQVTAMMTLPDQTFCESDPALTADGNNFIEITFTPVTTCYAPVNFEAVADADNNITLTWEMQSNVTVEGYNVYRAVGNGSYELIATVTEATYTDEALPDGTYRYQVTAINVLSIDNTCESEPALAVDGENNYVEIAIDGINDLSNLINVYPNPTKNNVNIEADNMSRIVIVNTLGQVVYDTTVSSNNTVINMSNFGAGLYMLNITTDNGVIVKRVTVAK